jgi:hypothetical protein
MVQVATAQFKINQGYMSGFRKLYGFSHDVLAALPPVYQGIDMDQLRRQFAEQLQQLPDQDKIEPGTYKQYGLDYVKLRVIEEA